MTQNSSPFFSTNYFHYFGFVHLQKRSWSRRTTTENIRHVMYRVTIIFGITPDIRSSCQKAIQTYRKTIQLPGSVDLEQKYIANPQVLRVST